MVIVIVIVIVIALIIVSTVMTIVRTLGFGACLELNDSVVDRIHTAQYVEGMHTPFWSMPTGNKCVKAKRHRSRFIVLQQ